MDQHQVDRMLEQTLDDQRLSRSERRALAKVFDELAEGEHDLDVIRSRAFAVARQALSGTQEHRVVEWLEEVVKTVAAARETAPEPVLGEVVFSPGTACVARLATLIAGARRAIDACVFTITDDRISGSLIAAHGRGVIVRIITDDHKSADLGSDIDTLREAGIRVAFDNSSAHMHHKFAIFDHTTVVTGSYNWTRSAADENQENLVVTDHPRIASRFRDEFRRLWKEFGDR